VTTEAKSTIRCAIYTRKSSEEGLEQSFNSLDAQREACQAFIASQKQEGWRALNDRYDDGGYSGGNLTRPGLKRLLDDVEAHKVDTIVVYKVDRLTRSLADFAKIVEALDARGVSFVSVTQQFNTTSSMGRLTLNVLLSFAQFEREVTGERIRDKIAASKRKGMWMGGPVPLGYDLALRKLVPNTKEADLVSKIFTLYLKVGCVSKLAVQLDCEKIRSKAWVTRGGARLGGVPFARGALYDLLRNRLYIGEIRHRDSWYPGEHKGIVPQEIWDKVQTQLNRNLQTRHTRVKEQASSLLTGLLEDAAGNRFTPSFTTKRGRRYRYYVSQDAIRNPGSDHDHPIRVPAPALEDRVIEKVLTFLKSDADVFDRMRVEGELPSASKKLAAGAKTLAKRLPLLSVDKLRDHIAMFLRRVIIQESGIEVMISRQGLRELLKNGDQVVVADRLDGRKPFDEDDMISLTIEAKLKRRGGEVHLVVPPNFNDVIPRHPKPALIKAVVRAHGWYEKVVQGKALDMRSLARQAGLTQRYVRKVFACAFLAPDIIESILEGSQPEDLTFENLSRHVPLSWDEQRTRFGFETKQWQSGRRLQ
jgi:site-specific DNA recombinase